jgi:hypothetical protein
MPEYRDADYSAVALIDGRALDNAAIRDIERARGALAYLKNRIGNTAMRTLLKDDLARTQARNRAWVEASSGRWKAGSVEFVVPGPGAGAFHAWFMRAMKEDRHARLLMAVIDRRVLGAAGLSLQEFVRFSE